MFIAQVMRAGGLKIYLACDRGIIRQDESVLESISLDG
jgi:hypothetical protein